MFAKAAAISNTSVQGMTEAMKQASTVADFYGVSLEIHRQRWPARAAQHRRQRGRYSLQEHDVQPHVADAGSEAGDEGVEPLLYDSQGNLKGYREVLEQLSGAFANLDQKSRLEGLAAIFTERGLKAANTVLTDYRN